VTAPPKTQSGTPGPGALGWFGRIRVRLLVVNLLLVLVPVVGLEFARLYERQLLVSLERDMRNQAVLLTQVLLADLERGVMLGDESHERALEYAARSTRTRLRVIDASFSVVADSHRHGPPEGREPQAPSLVRYRDSSLAVLGVSLVEGPEIPLRERDELKRALRGRRGTVTRLRRNPPAVLLFLAEPIRQGNALVGAVYVTRSTQPVLVEMHRIRSGLLIVLGLAFASTAVVTLLLAWTLTRPIEQLARAARKIAGGERDVKLPEGGGGELTELSLAIDEMTQKLEARHRYISEFAADVAHEFKSPLTSIRGAAELLVEGAADDPSTRARFLRNILLDAERLDQLVSRLLELSRIESSDEPLTLESLDAIVRKAVERCETPDQAIEYRSSGALHLLKARSRDLETALLNLLDNALRYSPPEVPIVVEVVRNAERSRIGVQVSDQGPGIAKEQQAKIFERFYTTNGEGGTGLGLSIVASVAEAHRGSVEVHSNPGAGATFTLWLPFSATGE
jgi:two-component system sensor histidine kinase ChvG